MRKRAEVGTEQRWNEVKAWGPADSPVAKCPLTKRIQQDLIL